MLPELLYLETSGRSCDELLAQADPGQVGRGGLGTLPLPGTPSRGTGLQWQQRAWGGREALGPAQRLACWRHQLASSACASSGLSCSLKGFFQPRSVLAHIKSVWGCGTGCSGARSSRARQVQSESSGLGQQCRETSPKAKPGFGAISGAPIIPWSSWRCKYSMAQWCQTCSLALLSVHRTKREIGKQICNKLTLNKTETWGSVSCFSSD